MYCLSPGVRARKEGFGLLFYSSKDAKLTFVKSGGLLRIEPGPHGERLFELVRRSRRGREGGPPSGRFREKALLLSYDLTNKYTLTAPVNVTWEITSRCNLRCRHCLSADLMNECDRELDFEECCRFIDSLDRMEVFQVNFGGGEPFLREDFLDILDYAHGKQITTCVSTNGTLVDEALG